MLIVFWSLLIFLAMTVAAALSFFRLSSIKLKTSVGAIVGVVQAGISIAVLTRIVRNPTHTAMAIAYVLGLVLGLFLGLIVSDRLSRSMYSTCITFKKDSRKMEKLLKDQGFKVSCCYDSKMVGELHIIRMVTRKRHLAKIKELVNHYDQHAFVISCPLASSSQGYGQAMAGRVLLLNKIRSD